MFLCATELIINDNHTYSQQYDINDNCWKILRFPFSFMIDRTERLNDFVLMFYFNNTRRSYKQHKNRIRSFCTIMSTKMSHYNNSFVFDIIRAVLFQGGVSMNNCENRLVFCVHVRPFCSLEQVMNKMCHKNEQFCNKWEFNCISAGHCFILTFVLTTVVL